jgi:hypothetical protein
MQTSGNDQVGGAATAERDSATALLGAPTGEGSSGDDHDGADAFDRTE